MSPAKRKKPKSKTSLDQAFERALRAAAKSEGPDISMGAVRLRTGKGESKRRFIGQAQIDIKYKGVRSMPGGSPVPWYVATIGVGRIRHKLSLGAPASWHKDHGTPMDDKLIDAIAQSAVRFSMDSEDDNIPDDVTDVVEQATQGVMLEDGSYQVRKTI